MELRFAPLALAGLDALKTELLCLVLFEDERPPRGAAGLADWRLCGRLSQLIASATFAARWGEALLMPPAGRLPAERLMLLGAGARAQVDEPRFGELLDALIERVLGLRVRTLALSLPHASLACVPPARAIDALLERMDQLAPSLDELVLLETPAAQRAMEPRIERKRRRAELDV